MLGGFGERISRVGTAHENSFAVEVKISVFANAERSEARLLCCHVSAEFGRKLCADQIEVGIRSVPKSGRIDLQRGLNLIFSGEKGDFFDEFGFLLTCGRKACIKGEYGACVFSCAVYYCKLDFNLSRFNVWRKVEIVYVDLGKIFQANLAVDSRNIVASAGGKPVGRLISVGNFGEGIAVHGNVVGLGGANGDSVSSLFQKLGNVEGEWVFNACVYACDLAVNRNLRAENCLLKAEKGNLVFGGKG